MRRVSNSYRKKRLQIKIGVLIFCVLLLVGTIVAKQCYRSRNEQLEQETAQENNTAVLPDANGTGNQEHTQSNTESKVERTENVPKFGTEEMADIDSQNQGDTVSTTARIPITNLDEYALAVMGEETKLLEESLGLWVEDKMLTATEGTIFHVHVPKSDPQSIQFYMKLNDEAESLVMCAYHPRENVVTASMCMYTEEEIINEIWEGNQTGPQDVSPQEDVPVIGEEAGVNDISGEN